MGQEAGPLEAGSAQQSEKLSKKVCPSFSVFVRSQGDINAAGGDQQQDWIMSRCGRGLASLVACTFQGSF